MEFEESHKIAKQAEALGLTIKRTPQVLTPEQIKALVPSTVAFGGPHEETAKLLVALLSNFGWDNVMSLIGFDGMDSLLECLSDEIK